MFNLIKCEFFKLRKSMAFYVLLGTQILLSIFATVLSIVMADNITNASTKSALYGINALISTLSDTSLIMILGSILAGIFICSDFENRTFQGAISSGNGRGRVLLSKVLVYFAALSIISIPYPVIYSVVMTITNGFGAPIDVTMCYKVVGMFLSTFVINASILSVAVLCAFVIKKSGAVIGISIGLLALGGNIFIGLGNFSQIVSKILPYTPLGLNSWVMKQDVNVFDFNKVVLIGLVYISIFVFATYRMFRKAELK